jgi:cell fate regulator YaaT (PSP1 superfamily)
MGKNIQIRLGEYRPVGWYDAHDVVCQRGDQVIMEADGAVEVGLVVSDSEQQYHCDPGPVQGKVIRKVTEGDWNQIHNNQAKAREAIDTCERKVNERHLEMRIIQAEYTFDCSKIIFYFTADGRIDFRSLVKDLAKIFRVRIELKQIGVRDRAKIVCGYGVCGRSLCCSSYMNDFHSLSIKMAKEQALPLNPSRISGVCGRIKCCMSYEFAAYQSLSKGLPHVGDKVSTLAGKGRVMDVNILKRLVLVDLGESKTTKVFYPPLEPGSDEPGGQNKKTATLAEKKVEDEDLSSLPDAQ